MNKIISHILLSVLLILSTVSCYDHLQVEDLETQRDATEETYLEYLIASVIENAAKTYQNLSYKDMLLPCTAMHYQTLSGETQNSYLDFYHTRGDWDTFYSQLRLVYASVTKAQEEENPAYEGIFLIFKAFYHGLAADLYGPAIYTEALQGRDGVIYPSYDKEEVIYEGILSDLKTANELIKSSPKDISSTGDILYGGDLEKWQKFANSLRLRYLMRVSGKMPAWAEEGISEMLSDEPAYPLFDSADDNAGLTYIGTISSDSWPGGDLNMGNTDFLNRRPTRMIVDTLVAYNDPRIKIWLAPAEKPWTTDPEKDGMKETISLNGYDYEIEWEYLSDELKAEYGSYIVRTDSYWVGLLPGTTSTSLLRHDNGNYDENTDQNYKVSTYSNLFHENANGLLKATMMNADEVQFLLAEAIVKGVVSSGNAENYYKKGIGLSLCRWGISDESTINGHLSDMSLSSNADEALTQIATQKWLALLFSSAESYLDTRRTGLPDYSGVVSTRDIPVRFRYPTSESGQNTENYEEAISWLSPAEDDEFSKVWLLQ